MMALWEMTDVTLSFHEVQPWFLGGGPGDRPATSIAYMGAGESRVHGIRRPVTSSYPTRGETESLGKKLQAATDAKLSVRMYPLMHLGGAQETVK